MPCGRIGTTELLIIALLIVLLFGASRLGDLGTGLGLGIRRFKKALRDDDATGDKHHVDKQERDK